MFCRFWSTHTDHGQHFPTFYSVRWASCSLIDMCGCVLLMWVCERERVHRLLIDVTAIAKEMSQALVFITVFIRAASLILTCMTGCSSASLECHTHQEKQITPCKDPLMCLRLDQPAIISVKDKQRQNRMLVMHNRSGLWSSEDMLLFLLPTAVSNHSLLLKRLKCNNCFNANVWAQSIQLEKTQCELIFHIETTS